MATMKYLRKLAIVIALSAIARVRSQRALKMGTQIK
jgi:hypothetical protein